MRNLKNPFLALVALALALSTSACKNEPEAPSTQPAITVDNTFDMDRAKCFNADVTVEYENGSQETISITLERHPEIETRYNGNSDVVDDESKVTKMYSIAVFYNDDGTFSSSGSTAYYSALSPLPVTKDFEIKLISPKSNC